MLAGTNYTPVVPVSQAQKKNPDVFILVLYESELEGVKLAGTDR